MGFVNIELEVWNSSILGAPIFSFTKVGICLWQWDKITNSKYLKLGLDVQRGDVVVSSVIFI